MGTLRANICSSVTVAHIMVLLFCQFMIDYARYFPPCCIQFLFVRLSLTWVTARHLSWLLINMAWQTDPASYVGWVCCWFTLFREVFLRVLRFSPLLKNQPNSNSIWIIVKYFIMSLWLVWSRKHCPVFGINFLHLHLHCSHSRIPISNISDSDRQTKWI